MAWATGVRPAVARRGGAHGSGLGTHRRVIEQTIALLHWYAAVAVFRCLAAGLRG
jgi:hypothetical protein